MYRRYRFTFHYASTLSKIRVIIQDWGWPFTFHYASTLSKMPRLICCITTAIYIPLCFYFIPKISIKRIAQLYLHSTMLLLYRGCLRNLTALNFHIYIPLCFYFISILLLSLSTIFYLHSTMLLLYLLRDHIIESYLPDLHSTMLLLYRIIFSSIWLCFTIYIPLCFYFIPARSVGDTCPQNTFTFHYASTLSVSSSVCVLSFQ